MRGLVAVATNAYTGSAVVLVVVLGRSFTRSCVWWSSCKGDAALCESHGWAAKRPRATSTNGCRQMLRAIRDGVDFFLLRRAAASGILRAVSLLAGLATSVMLARALDLEAYGTYTLSVAWLLLLSIPATQGLDTLAIRKVSEFSARSSPGAVRGFMRWAIRNALVVSIAVAALCSVVVAVLRASLGPEFAACFLIAMVGLPLQSLARVLQGGIHGRGRAVVAQLPLLMVVPIAFLVLVAVVFYLVRETDPAFAVLARVAALGLGVGIGIRLLYGRAEEWQSAEADMNLARDWRRSAIPLLWLGIAVVATEQVTVAMVGGILGPSVAGLYDVARRASMLISLPLIAVNMPLAPAIARMYTAGRMDALQALVWKAALLAALGALPIAIACFSFGGYILSVYGASYREAAGALRVLAIGEVGNTLAGSVALLLNMTGHERNAAMGVTIAALVNVLLNAVLIPLFGLQGAAAATSASLVVWNVILAISVRRKLGIDSSIAGWMVSRARHLRLRQ